jgi:hypothetical protein
MDYFVTGDISMVTGPDRQGLEDAEDIYDPLHV